MYNPPRYQVQDDQAALDLMDRNPFATLISVFEGEPVVTHAPLTPKRVAGGFELIGHIAKANPHWKTFAHSRLTAIFQGAHGYVTPVWYAKNNVPTWNYSVVHASGPVELIEDEAGILKCLEELTAHAERHWPSGWRFFVPENLQGPHLEKAIVGFRVKVESLNFKRKLHQAASPADRAGVLRGLQERGDAGSLALLADMWELYDESGERRQ